MHKLKLSKQKQHFDVLKSNVYERGAFFYLIIKAAATFRTFGHLSSAITVNKFPQMPTIIIKMVTTAAQVNSGRLNLKGFDKESISEKNKKK